MTMMTRNTFDDDFGNRPALPPLARVSRVAIAVIITLLIIPVGLIALGSGLGLVRLPYEMFLLSERLPVIFKLHMLTGAAVLLLAPFVIAVRRQTSTHRMLGRILGGFVIVAGLSAFPVALISHSPLLARVGFFVQGLVWLGLFAMAIGAIRRGDRARHVRLMLAMVAVTSGAVWFRVLTGSAIVLDLPFAEIYSAAAWIGWLIPLAIVLSFDAIPRAFVR
jgi:hypothetical protein